MDKNSPPPSNPPRLLDLVRAEIRLRHYSYKTEKSYIGWIKRYIFFHGKKHRKDLGADDITKYLSYLATKRRVSAGTQNQALNALVFLYKHVLKQDPGKFEGLVRAKRPRYIPPILSDNEIARILTQLQGRPWLMVSLLYGTAMRLSECLRLRVKDLDFERNQIVIRDSKGEKDRVVMFPRLLKAPLTQQLLRARKFHEIDLAEGFGTVEMPYALERKYPNANREWGWKFVFPSHKRSIDPRSGIERRHHVYDSILQDYVRNAVRRAGITKRVTAHSFRHAAATSWLQRGADIRTVQELLGHNSVKTTMIYTHVLECGPSGTQSPLDAIKVEGRYDTPKGIPQCCSKPSDIGNQTDVSPGGLSASDLTSAAEALKILTSMIETCANEFPVKNSPRASANGLLRGFTREVLEDRSNNFQ